MLVLFKQAIVEMMHHKLRTLLTLLGMVFGVGAVIAMLSIGEGAKVESTRLIESMGLRNLVINEKLNDNETLKEIRKSSVGLSLNDMRTIESSLPFVSQSCAEKNLKTYSVFSNQSEADSSVIAVSPNCFSMSNLKIEAGDFFTQDDNNASKQVAVIGSEVAKSLFADKNPIGELIKINHLWVKVVGVLQQQELSKKEIQGIKLGAEHNRIFLPLATAQKRLKIPNLESQIDSIRVTIDTTIEPQVAALAIDKLLKRRHGNVEDFEIIVPASLLNQQNKTQQIFTIVMSSIAGISLLVGGIGIMNIMLATILERTKEIGLMRAVGATKVDIKNQFLIESTTIAAVGALLGIVMGVLLSFIIQSFAEWPVQWSLFSIILAVGVCLITGIIFGYYPAKKAAELDPILALQKN
ncbi:MAG TPA: ABC transporter permease [Gammaproteobacteria bacterium]|jgi:putative ABC transport system permease protein|nr:ABC transporter permease [Xanthomonadales bacterium]MCB1594279.1 ABC transporter permease [Xanthomonadales bacterium]HOP22175.1 ABC transporter permease [Gammaproteobacteria bacterium]HPI95126.1 ABC transporter permease [Gammaproteobacteria bacterium]HPQ86884.1 ABC transporter permease [Gammaproteobacteria bacterium]